MSSAQTYFITWTCYGTWLHGDECGSVDRNHNSPGSPFIPEDSRFVHRDRALMAEPPYCLGTAARRIVLRAVWEVCCHRGWDLLAVHVRSNHIHTLVTADASPERVMNDFKVYGSRALNAAGEPPRHRWTRHGSTRYIKKEDQREAVLSYIYDGQGAPMERWKPGDPEPVRLERMPIVPLGNPDEPPPCEAPLCEPRP